MLRSPLRKLSKVSIAIAATVSTVSWACSLAHSEGKSHRRTARAERAVLASEEGDEHPHPFEPRTYERPPATAPDGADFDALSEPTVTDAAGGRRAYFGLLHAHTMFSDGSGTPTQAFQMAKSEGLDFMAVTPHNHASAENGVRKPSHGPRKDGVMIGVQHDLYSSPNLVPVTRNFKDAAGNQQTQSFNVKALVQSAEDETNSEFVALFGQEYSTISDGNHVNVIGIETVLTLPKGAHGELYQLLDGLPEPLVVQMNHPSFAADLFHASTKPSDRDDDYGLDDFGGDFASLIEAADKYLVVLEVISGPATTMETFDHQPRRNTHERDYYFYLSQGLHISPSAGQDNHWKDWGKKTPSRTGVIADDLTRSDLLKAIRANQTYATEDSDLVVEFSCDGKLMGSVLTVSAGDTIQCGVTATDNTDADPSYFADLFTGSIVSTTAADAVQLTPDAGHLQAWELQGGGRIEFDPEQALGTPEFLYVRIEQRDGDRAWSAPIWINHPRNYSID